MNLEEANEILAKVAQGRVSIKFSETQNLYYVYDSFVGPGMPVQGTFDEATARVNAMDDTPKKYAMWVEKALTDSSYPTPQTP